MNVLPCSTGDGSYHLPGHGAGPFDRGAEKSAVKLGIRPEHIELADPEGAACTGRVEVVEYLGADTYLYLDCGDLGQLIVRTDDAPDGIRGKTVGLAFEPKRLHFFDENDQAV